MDQIAYWDCESQSVQVYDETMCAFCLKRKAVGTLYREIGFGVEVSMGTACAKCAKAIRNR